jgi:hypothetical protein
MCDQMHDWKKWEQETRQENFDCTREGKSGWFLCDPSASANKMKATSDTEGKQFDGL